MVCAIDSGKLLLDDGSVEVYNWEDDAKLILTDDNELRLCCDEKCPLVARYEKKGVYLWDRVNKKERMVPWRAIEKARDVVKKK
jgi:hypothetical protein